MPSGHGVLRLFDVLDAGNETLPELLSQRGYETAGFVTHLLLRREFGFAQGFAHYDESAVGGHKAITSKRVTDRVIQWLEGRESTAPFFLFVHYFDPHFVFHHHPEHDLTAGYEGSLEPGMDIWDLRDGRASLRPDDLAYLIGLHREEIAFTDSQLGRLLAQLQKRDLEQSTLVVVTADHGEEFMRHGWIGHTRTLYDELLHVPLVIRLPGAARRGEVETPVSLLDLLPTLIEVVDRKAGNASWEGLSLVPELEGRAAGTTGRDLYAEVSFGRGRNATGRAAQQTAFKTALLGSQLKLIHDLLNGGFELYDRSRDRDELRDLSGAQPAEAEMRTRLLRWENSRSPRAGEPSEASPDTGETEGP
jgi:arylsulfatase A-like enzyme